MLWQTSQTINFAQGEFVMLPAFFVLAAMNAGAPFWLACLIGIALSIVILGILFKLIVVDPMLKYGVLPLVISTIALSLFLKESAKDFYSSQAQPFPALVPATDIHFFEAVVSTQSLVVLAVAILTVVALNILLNKTRLGRQMQATAQNTTLARILGIPVQRMVLYTFLLNAVLVAIASILVSPIYLAKFTNGETLGMAAFIAAIIGGFNQVRGAILGGYSGRARQFVRCLYFVAVSRRVPIDHPDCRDSASPTGPARADRGTDGMIRLGALAVVIAIVAALAAPFFLKPYGIFLISTWAVLTIAAIGLNLTLGYAGQISLAQGAFVGIGAYTVALLTPLGVPFFLAFFAAGLLCFAVGWGLGYPALRVQHHYLAFVTLAFTTLVFLVLRNEQWLTNGIYGITGTPRPTIFGWKTNGARDFYFLCLGTLSLFSLAAWWMLRSPWGRAFVALRENPIRALSLGLDTRRYTLMAFAIGSKSRRAVRRAIRATSAIH